MVDFTNMYETFVQRAVDVAFLWMPPIACACAWWFWARRDQTTSIPLWRRIAAICGLLLVTLSIGFGSFAWAYWRYSRGYSSGPPEPTFIATYCGAILAVLSVPCSALATSWTRISLCLCSLGLLGFYFLMFLSP